MQTGTFFVIKTDKGFLMPYTRDYKYHFSDNIHEANRYKEAKGTTGTLKELSARGHKVSISQIDATYTEADTKDAGLDQLYAPQLKTYRNLLAQVKVDIEALSSPSWRRFISLNETLSALGLVKRWKR